MNPTIAVKAGVKSLPLFDDHPDFRHFEAYTAFRDDLDDLLTTRLNLACIHLTNTVEPEGKAEPVNFADHDLVGELSYRKLREAIDFSNAHGVPLIVLHLGTFNTFKEEKNAVIDRVAAKFFKLDFGGVKVCLENIPRFTHLCFDREPLITTAADMLRFRNICPSIGFALDVDHCAINAVFNNVARQLSYSTISPAMIPEFRNAIGRAVLDIPRESPARYTELVDDAIRDLFQSIRPDVVHACGSDFCNYTDNGSLPLTGEALPLCFKGTIRGAPVQDRVNHSTWIPFVRPDTLITMEFLMRAEYDPVEQSTLNMNFLKEAFGGR